MNLKSLAVTLVLSVFVLNVYAQNELNPYKYIVVPKKFDFLKEENQYRVNSYTKFLFDKEGYQVFYDDADFPEDLKLDPCLALTANVLNESSTFTTKIFLVLENCARDEVLRSVEGRSKMKEYNKTYLDALKKCFVSVQELNYEYEPKKLTQESNEIENSPSNTEIKTVAVTAAVVPEEKVEEEKKVKNESAAKPEVSSGEKTQTSVAPVAIVAAPVVVKEKEARVEPEVETIEQPIVARAFKNDTISFLLIDQGAQLQAFVSQSKNDKYKPGELIGTFKKSSLPNVYKVSWKKPEEGVEETTAYFDDLGNLKVDIYRNGNLETLTFIEIK
jgi:hypothetical protein